MNRPSAARYARSLSAALVRGTRTRKARLNVELMEDRAVPAVFNLTIDGNAATTASSASGAGVTTFTATANNQNVSVADIRGALNAGNNVVITTGSNDQVNITWDHTSSSDDLSYSAATVESLAFQTRGGSFSAGASIQLSDNLDLQVSTVSGAITLQTTTVNGPYYTYYYGGISQAHSVILDAGIAAVTIDSPPSYYYAPFSTGSGDVTILGSSLTTTTGAVISSGHNLDLKATINPNGQTVQLGASNDLTLEQTVDGAGTLRLSADKINIQKAIGSSTPLDMIDFQSGTVNFGINAISATDVVINGATFGAGTGIITGDVTLNSGTLAPGGIANGGVLKIVGDVELDGGTVSVDFGPPTDDQIQITGNLNINGAFLGDNQATGNVGSSGATIFTLTGGTRTGIFPNADQGELLFLGADVVSIDYTSTAVKVNPAPAAPKGTFKGVEEDGTSYTVTLTGGGQLVVGKDQNADSFIFVRNATATSQLNVTTKANASDKLVIFDLISVQGPLKGFNGANVDVSTFHVDGAAKSITLHDLEGPMTLGGSPTDSTSLTLKDILGSVTSSGALGKITVAKRVNADITAASIGALKAQEVDQVNIQTTPGGIGSITTTDFFAASVTAASVGAVKVGTYLEGGGGPWTVAGSIGSITAAAIQSVDVTAKSIGSLTATGDKAEEISGDIYNSHFQLTGDDGSAKHYGLKTITAKGNVFDSHFLIQAANVDSVTVGRFIDSDLFLNYLPVGAFNTGSFLTTSVFKLNKFTTTAATIGDPSSNLNYAFANSRIAADTIGTVKLSGVKTVNSGTAFGIKFKSSVGSIKVASADEPTAVGTFSSAMNRNDFVIVQAP
jgi:hypothetical protein